MRSLMVWLCMSYFGIHVHTCVVRERERAIEREREMKLQPAVSSLALAGA